MANTTVLALAVLLPTQTQALRRRLAAAAGVDSDGAVLPDARPADALLLLSGNHPGRRLPIIRHFLPDVYDELRLATRMRDRCVNVW